MTYNAQGIGKSGARKRLVDEVLNQVEAVEHGLPLDLAMLNVKKFVIIYKKETSK